jgi:hypothetical protein
MHGFPSNVVLPHVVCALAFIYSPVLFHAIAAAVG